MKYTWGLKFHCGNVVKALSNYKNNPSDSKNYHGDFHFYLTALRTARRRSQKTAKHCATTTGRSCVKTCMRWKWQHPRHVWGNEDSLRSHYRQNSSTHIKKRWWHQQQPHKVEWNDGPSATKISITSRTLWQLLPSITPKSACTLVLPQTVDDLSKAIDSIPNGKAPGKGGIQQKSSDVGIRHSLFTYTSSFASVWKKSCTTRLLLLLLLLLLLEHINMKRINIKNISMRFTWRKKQSKILKYRKPDMMQETIHGKQLWISEF